MTDPSDSDRNHIKRIATELGIDAERLLAAESKRAPGQVAPTVPEKSFAASMQEHAQVMADFTEGQERNKRLHAEGIQALNESTAALQQAGKNWDALAQRAVRLAMELDPAIVAEVEGLRLPLLEALDQILIRVQQKRTA
jgi:hypothetical protein